MARIPSHKHKSRVIDQQSYGHCQRKSICDCAEPTYENYWMVYLEKAFLKIQTKLECRKRIS